MSKPKKKKNGNNGDTNFAWRVVVPRKVFDTIIHVASCAEPHEVQLLSEVTYERGTFRVHNVHLIKQEVSGTSASFDSRSLAQFVSQHPHPERLRGWVHSHVRMGLFWSGTDEGTIERFVRRGWCLSIVVVLSEGGKAQARVDVNFEPLINESDEVLRIMPPRATWDNVPIEIEDILTEDEKELLKESVADKVISERPFRPPKVSYRIANEEEQVCPNCLYETENSLCEKGVERGDIEGDDGARSVVGCKLFYPGLKSVRGTSH